LSDSAPKQQDSRLRLRQQDWLGKVLVQDAIDFGPSIDKHGLEKEFVVLVHCLKDIGEVLALIQGDSKIKALVLVPSKPGCSLPPEATNGNKFSETKLPLLDATGRVVTKTVQKWTNLAAAPTAQMRVVVPAEKRPPKLNSDRNDTAVFRLTLDKRYTDPQVWNKVCKNPGPAARNWLHQAAPAVKPSLMDTWGWQLHDGAAGKSTVIKGLVRVRKGPAIGHLLTGSGKIHVDLRFFWTPSNGRIPLGTLNLF
jgi:hypothetical protein